MSALPLPQLRFAPMAAGDLDTVTQADQVLYEYPWTRNNFADSLAAGYSAWVMRSDGCIAGYAVMMLALDEAHLLNLSVLAVWQRRGYGRRMLDFLCAVARRARAERMFLEVRPSNRAALELYLGYGFHRIGLRRGYYPAAAGREDAIVMVSAL